MDMKKLTAILLILMALLCVIFAWGMLILVPLGLLALAFGILKICI